MFNVEIKKNNVRTPEFCRFSFFIFISDLYLANDTEKESRAICLNDCFKHFYLNEYNSK